MRKVIIAVALAAAVAVAGCSSGPSRVAACENSPAVKADLARLNAWVGNQSAGIGGGGVLHQEKVWISQALAACKADRPLPVLPEGA